jgi:hypothetical protein
VLYASDVFVFVQIKVVYFLFLTQTGSDVPFCVENSYVFESKHITEQTSVRYGFAI